jgi:hypothetical protein
METAFTSCAKCGKDIKFGSDYVTISKTIEIATRNNKDNDITIDVKDTVEYVTLCKSCGDKITLDPITSKFPWHI